MGERRLAGSAFEGKVHSHEGRVLLLSHVQAVAPSLLPFSPHMSAGSRLIEKDPGEVAPECRMLQQTQKDQPGRSFECQLPEARRRF